MTADEMFKELGYKKHENEYCSMDICISFWKNDKTFVLESDNGKDFSIEEFNLLSKAINKKVEELQWL